MDTRVAHKLDDNEIAGHIPLGIDKLINDNYKAQIKVYMFEGDGRAPDFPTDPGKQSRARWKRH